MFFVVRSNDSFNFPLGLIKYIVICPVFAWKRRLSWKFLFLYCSLHLLNLACVLILIQNGSSYLCYILLFIFGRDKQGIIVFVSFITNLSLWGGSAWGTLKWPSPFKLRCRLRVDKPPISERIKYKVVCLCFSAVNGSGSACLSELLHVYNPSRTLRSSSDTRMLKIQQYKRKTHG